MDMSTSRFEEEQSSYLAAAGVAATVRWIGVPLEAGTVRTQVLEVGAGPPVVLVHGGGGLAAGFAPLIARMQGCRVLAPDRPGCGASSAMDYRGVHLRAHAVRWMEGVLDALEIESAVLVANSMGARWATWFALAHPRRVRGIAALGVPAFLLETSAPVPMRLLGTWLGQVMMALEPPSDAQARRLWRRMGHPEGPATEALVALMVALQERPGYALAWRTLLGRCLRLPGAAAGMALDEGELARLTMPMAFGVGTHDPFGGVDVVKRAAAATPDATVEVAGIGHLPWLDDPDAYAKIVMTLLSRVERAGAEPSMRP